MFDIAHFTQFCFIINIVEENIDDDGKPPVNERLIPGWLTNFEFK
jgi:ribosomal protein S2